MGDKAREGRAYDNLGNAYKSLGNFKTAIEFYEHCQKIATEVGDKAMEKSTYGNLADAYDCLGDFKTAIEYQERCLKIEREVGDKVNEGRTCGNLGNAYEGLGDFKTAIDYYERCLKIAREVGDKAIEGYAYGNLGSVYRSLGNFKTAIEYNERCLKIAEEVGDKTGEQMAYCNLGNAYQSLQDFKTAIDYFKRCVEVSKEVGDKSTEGSMYGNLGIAYKSLGNFKTAIEYHERCLKIVQELGSKAKEGATYGNLGIAYRCLGEFKTAIDYHNRSLKIAKEVGNKAGEEMAYGDLGNAYHCLGDFKTAIDYYERCSKYAAEVGDKSREGETYNNLGIAYKSLGYFKTAIEYHEHSLKIAKEVASKALEGITYGSLGNAYSCLGDFKTAIEYHNRYLKFAKEVGDKAGEGIAYGNLANTCQRLGDFKTAIDYYRRYLRINIEVGDKAGEGRAYFNLGSLYQNLEEFKTAIDNYEHCLKISKELGDKALVAESFYGLGRSFERQGSLLKALDCYHSSVSMFNKIRQHLKCKDEWKVSYRDITDCAYASLWRLSLKQGKVVEALSAAEQGRAQALNDLMELNYGLETAYQQSNTPDESAYDSFSFLRSTAVFIATDERDIVFWVVQNGKVVDLRKKEFSDSNSLELNSFFKSLILAASQKIGARAGVKCEDRSLDNLADEKVPNERSPESRFIPFRLHTNVLRTFYDIIIGPISDLVRGKELILVPEGPLCLAPYAAFMDPNSRYLCEFCRIRMIPSLTSLKLITESPDGYHSKTGALLVGDPWLQEVVFQGRILEQLPCAKEEVEMIGRILNTEPLIGRQAKKDEVLSRLSSVALVHIAAHGRMETGEIALAPNITRKSQIPVEEDFLLTMKDVMSVQIRARLVVLSCCHSGRGEIKAEGVVGIARAFLGAGARSVLVSLWAIDDEATLEFMKSFYSHLAEGRSASESLNQAMKCMRESDDFNEVKYWAPFVLIGDDVTLEFGGNK